MERGDNVTSENPPPQTSRMGRFSPWIILLAAVSGGAVPFLSPLIGDLPSDFSPASLANDTSENSSRITYVPFGEVTVNLDEGRMNRYLRLKMALQVLQDDQEMVTNLAESRSLELRNWLLSHLSDKNLDDIRGKVGQNQLRREIRNQFNTVLFPNGRDRINDILFEEFNVQ
ncbi:flagellar basal body-associated FliL family protein [Thalassoglobus sp. JC818]|uniref:flagellar basal body-associated FliL family protein n=1 Tax=Thalassoglobus sp. JC818 TaxID=3232136 RepID=UPI0034588F92